MAKCLASGIETRATITAGGWGCDHGHALAGIEFVASELPALPLPECPYAPHCSCTYCIVLQEDKEADKRSREERDAEFEAMLDALPTPQADEIIRQLDAALAGFGLPKYQRRRLI
jgi:hypothetical protein